MSNDPIYAIDPNVRNVPYYIPNKYYPGGVVYYPNGGTTTRIGSAGPVKESQESQPQLDMFVYGSFPSVDRTIDHSYNIPVGWHGGRIQAKDLEAACDWARQEKRAYVVRNIDGKRMYASSWYAGRLVWPGSKKSATYMCSAGAGIFSGIILITAMLLGGLFGLAWALHKSYALFGVAGVIFVGILVTPFVGAIIGFCMYVGQPK